VILYTLTKHFDIRQRKTWSCSNFRCVHSYHPHFDIRRWNIYLLDKIIFNKYILREDEFDRRGSRMADWDHSRCSFFCNYPKNSSLIYHYIFGIDSPTLLVLLLPHIQSKHSVNVWDILHHIPEVISSPLSYIISKRFVWRSERMVVSRSVIDYLSGILVVCVEMLVW